MSRRIGIMGGMFDPVHRGHMAAANTACHVLGLDCLYLVPCSRPNHRRQPEAGAQDRLRMLDRAVTGQSRLLADDSELRRGDTSYTVDTLRDFARREPDSTLVFVLGWDSFLTLPEWHQWRTIFEYAHICAISRPGNRLPAADSDSPTDQRLLAELEKRRVESVRRLYEQPSGGIFIIDDLSEHVSSSAIREAVAAGRIRESDLPPGVAEYIRAHGLYSTKE